MNLEHIAKLSGVSRSTVSRVINNEPSVTDTTRERVLEVIQRLNFQPNVVARSLAGGRTRVLGLVIPMGVARLFTDPYFPIFIQGVTSACNAHDHSMMLWLAEPEYERRMINQIVNAGLIDGVIISSSLIDDSLIDSLIGDNLPFVLIGRHPTNASINYVDVDNRESARQVVNHLLRKGRRRIATITGPQNMIAGLDRLEGYLIGLREWGLIPDPELIVDGSFSEEGSYLAVNRLLSRPIDAIFAASDTMAVGAIRAVREAGYRVPEDISVVGYDDIPLAAHTVPPLTTIRQPTQKMGALAVETLIDIIENPGLPPRRIILSTELVIRESD